MSDEEALDDRTPAIAGTRVHDCGNGLRIGSTFDDDALDFDTRIGRNCVGFPRRGRCRDRHARRGGARHVGTRGACDQIGWRRALTAQSRSRGERCSQRHQDDRCDAARHQHAPPPVPSSHRETVPRLEPDYHSARSGRPQRVVYRRCLTAAQGVMSVRDWVLAGAYSERHPRQARSRQRSIHRSRCHDPYRSTHGPFQAEWSSQRRPGTPRSASGFRGGRPRITMRGWMKVSLSDRSAWSRNVTETPTARGGASCAGITTAASHPSIATTLHGSARIHRSSRSSDPLLRRAGERQAS